MALYSAAGSSAPLHDPLRLLEGKELIMIEKQIGRTLAGAAKKSQETTFGAAEVLALALVVGFAAFCGVVLFL